MSLEVDQLRVVLLPLIRLCSEILSGGSRQYIGFLRHQVRHLMVRSH